MSKEIIEAVGVLEREKGISGDRLMAALEDALLSAYKKTPGSAKYARVEVDPASGDFRVFELILPPDLEEELLDEVEEEIGEAEGDMTFDEYQDRIGELVTGIVQQSDSRYTLVQLRERVEALLPRSEQVEGERYDHGS